MGFNRGSSRWVLKGVSLSFEESKVVTLVGPNGSGKTTLLKVAAMMYRPSKGRVLAWGVDVWSSGASLEVKRRVVYVHDRPILVRGTALYNVALGLILRGFGVNEALARARRLLEGIGLQWLGNKSWKSLSAGEAQLVSILRALIVEPRVILLDEPFSHLDVSKRKLVLSLLRERLEEGVGIVMASHDYLGIRMADRVVMLEDGRIRGIYEPEDLNELGV
jgi:ABC-type multidrug transport system ATPase subunit